MARQNSSSGASTAVASRAGEPPALLCRMSSRPKCPTAARIARSRLSGSVTSVGIAIAPWPARWAVSSPEAASISAIANLPPAPANRTAVARPIPPPAPVMKATLSGRRGIAHSFQARNLSPYPSPPRKRGPTAAAQYLGPSVSAFAGMTSEGVERSEIVRKLLMREQRQAGGLQPGLQDGAGLALGDEQGAAGGPAIGGVGRRGAGAGRGVVEGAG